MKRNFTLLLLLISFFATAQSETEPNNSFETANAMNANAVKTGAVNNTSDQYDYFYTVLPEDGTMKIYIQGTNNSASSNYLYMYGYDRRKGNGQVFGEYIGNSNTPAGATVRDTITVYGRAADTFYFRVQSAGAFSYSFSYAIADTSSNDAEPNNSFDTPVSIAELQEKKGHIGYLSNGTGDAEDYYKAVLPRDGTLKVYVKGTNQSGSGGYLYMYGYDRRKGNGQVFANYINNSNTPAGTTIYDTLTAYGRAADTFYFRVQSAGAFSYSFSYDVIDTSANDIEPNNTFDEPIVINHQQVKKGHISYSANGSDDSFDYYKTVLPFDGTLKIFVQGTNRQGSSGYLYLNGYDKRKGNGSVVGTYIGGSSNIKSDSTIYDTITVYGLLADTFYFRVSSAGAFSYNISYQMTLNSQPDEEPNNTFAEAVSMRQGIVKNGQVGYQSGGNTDNFDYFATVLPIDGTLKVYVKGTNNSASAGYLYMYGYDRRKGNGQIFGNYIKNSNTPAGATITDTITAYGRAADTFYFRLQSAGAFSYSFSYDIIDTSANDIEPNNSFDSPVSIAESQEKKGHIGYLYNGTGDGEDYYKAVLPRDGTLKVYVKGTNQSGSAGYLYMNGYDRRKGNGQIFANYINNSNTLAGTTIYDTLTAYGRMADTIYFRVTSSVAFNYSFNYAMVDTSANDVEPNNTFDTPVSIAELQEKKGHIGYLSNGTSDAEDYYKAVLPRDGTLKVYVKGTNQSGSAGYLYINGYDRRKGNGQVFANYINNSNTPAGTTIYDTLTAYGRMADTFYFRITSSAAFNYSFSYAIVDTSANDVEPNNTFDTPVSIAELQEKKGHIGYLSNGTGDAEDYYKAVLPRDGTLKVYVKGTNQSGSAGYLYMNGYDRRKGNGQVFANYIGSSNIKAGSTIYDTILVTCRAADTFYFRITSAGAFSYSFHYEMTNLSPADIEPNNTFATADTAMIDSVKYGHIGYQNNGTSDAADYYITKLPSRGTVQVIVEATNTSGGSGYLYLYGYRNRSQSVVSKYVGGTSNVPAGTTIRDTITINCLTTDTLFLQWVSSGCFRYSFVVKHISNDPVAGISHSIAGSLHEFSNFSSNAMSYVWNLGDGTSTIKNAPELKSYGAGSYEVKLIAKNTVCNLTDTASLRFTVNGLDRFTPKSGGPGNIEFTAYGGGFHKGMQVLFKKDGTVYKDSVSWVNEYGNIFAALIDMHNAPQGVYDIEIITKDTTYSIPKGFVSEALVDKLRSEITGRDIIRRNTNTPYSVRIYNEGNTMAGLAEVFVLFPSYMNVTVLNEVKNLLQPEPKDINFDTLPIFTKVTRQRGYPIDGNMYSFYLAGIPANGFKDLKFMVNSEVGRESIYTWVTGPMSGSDYKSWVDDCNKAKIKLVTDLVNDGLSVVPVADCAWGAAKAAAASLYSLYSWATGGSDETATTAGSVKTIAGFMKDCAGELGALAGGAPGVAIETADILTDVSVLGSNAYVNYNQIDIDCPDEPENPKPKPVDVRTSLDPNAKSGPAGFGEANYVLGSIKLMNYTIYFENVDTATLPAQEVIVTDTLDKNLFDLSSFKAMSFSVGTKTYPLPNGAYNFSEDVPFNSSLNVRISVKLDTATGVVNATFKAIDKATGQVTADPLAGFLPPNTNAPDGEGNISFAVNLKDGLSDGTVISNKAAIVFDNNEPIITDEWVNTLDRNLPVSRVFSAYQLNDSAVVVKATGNDPSSGLKYYRLYISTDGNDFIYAGNMGDTVIYPSKLNHTYSFYAIAVDSVGNIENKAPHAEATITTQQTLAILLGNITAANEATRNRIDWNTLHEDLGDRFEIEKSTDGRVFTTITKLAAKGFASAYTVFDEQPAEGRNYYRLKTFDKSGSYKTSKIVSVFVLSNKAFVVEAFPNPAKERLTINIHGAMSGKANITVINLTGSTVLQSTVTRSQETLDISNLPKGTYIVRYTDNNRTQVIKVTKQ